jgi:chromate transport protein ChrA
MFLCVSIFIMFVAVPLCLYVRLTQMKHSMHTVAASITMVVASALVDLSRAGNIDGADSVIITIGFTFSIYMSKLPPKHDIRHFYL